MNILNSNHRYHAKWIKLPMKPGFTIDCRYVVTDVTDVHGNSWMLVRVPIEEQSIIDSLNRY